METKHCRLLTVPFFIFPQDHDGAEAAATGVEPKKAGLDDWLDEKPTKKKETAGGDKPKKKKKKVRHQVVLLRLGVLLRFFL